MVVRIRSHFALRLFAILTLSLAAGPAFANVDIQGTLTSIKDFASTLKPLIFVLSLACGVFLLGNTFSQMVNAHRGQGSLAHGDGGVKVGPVAMRCGLASCMISFPFYYDTTLITLFGGAVSPDRALNYAPIAQMNSPQWTLAWGLVIAWVVGLGVVGMFRGLLLWNSAATESQGGGDYFWRGLWHIVGGAAAVNIGMFFS